LKEGSKLLVPSAISAEYEKQMAGLIEEQLVNLGLLKIKDIKKQDPENPLYKKYFMHGTAHHIGLDVHDVGLYTRTFEAGMVLTCEPGIYIPEEKIGCRLENDYLITAEGNINLTKEMPIEIEDIELLMQKK
jgi:Xaa-Pro aminopeptidase